MLRFVLIPLLLLMSVPAHGQRDVRVEVVETLSRRALDPVEGIWQFAPSDAEVAIVATAPGHFDMIVVDCPDKSVAPGTLMGSLVSTAKARQYDASVMTHVAGADAGALTSPRSVVIKVSDQGDALFFESYRQGVQVNIFGLLPYMYRRAFKKVDTRPNGIDGCLRRWPPTVTTPVYL